MNERIQELMEQATVQVDPDDREWVFFKVDQAKFAELIVRECAERLLNDAKLTDIQTTRCVASIREHFGVE